MEALSELESGSFAAWLCIRATWGVLRSPSRVGVAFKAPLVPKMGTWGWDIGFAA